MQQVTAAALLAVAGLAGCVTTEMTTAGAAVRMTANAEVVRGCRYVAMITGEDWANGGAFGQSAAEENAVRRALNLTAERGGNVLLLSTKSVGFSGATVRGEAYRCD